MMTLKRTILILSLSVVFLYSNSGAGINLTVIVNADNPTEGITKSELRAYYLKKKRNWPHGAEVRFLDRTSGSAVRKVFLGAIIERSTEDLELYWIGQKLYSGDSAPLQESSDEIVLHFVSTFEGAIGYVSNSTKVNTKKIKAIPVIDLD